MEGPRPTKNHRIKVTEVKASQTLAKTYVFVLSDFIKFNKFLALY